jgi:Esterase-like activity of phytase
MNSKRCAALAAVALGVAVVLSVVGDAPARADAFKPQFERIATFIVCENSSCDTNVVETTVAEITAASEDGRTLIYTDSPQKVIGLVDITDPARPHGLGTVKVDGEPTSVDIAGRYALVAVNTSDSFTEPSGHLAVFDLHECRANVASCVAIAKLDMGGQPDSVAVSPDRRYAAVVIENQRDEGVNDGAIPQLPGGFLNVVDLIGAPGTWKVRKVELAGLAAIAPDDPEPEFVKINRFNIAAVTLQENNHIALVHLPTGKVVNHFSAGAVNIDQIDIEENRVFELTGTLASIKREPDAIAWVGDWRLVTANEGDLDGGSRGFSIFAPNGSLLFDAGNDVEHLAVRHGHYPEDRAENKGVEPEGVAVAKFGGDEYIFVGSERGNFVAVYRDRGWGKPDFVQLLATGIGPEGLLAIPSRRLFIASTETDAGARSQINIYRLQHRPASYPTVVSRSAKSADSQVAVHDGKRDASVPIGWGALSALAADRRDPHILYTVHDSFYQRSRIYTMDVSKTPAVITDELVLRKNGATVNYDLEGLAQRKGGGFWAVSEGAGNAPSATTKNLLVEIARDGTIVQEIELPASVNALQRSNGFEGVTVVGADQHEKVYVAFQREWAGDPAGFVRIGEYRPSEKKWRFFYYPIDAVASPAGGSVGLSEITALDDDRFAVIERDSIGGPDARIKKIYVFSIAGLVPQEQGSVTPFPVVTKKLAIDMLPIMRATHGWTLDKLEGFAVAKNGEAYAVTDNDGLDEASGETQFFRLGKFRH